MAALPGKRYGLKANLYKKAEAVLATQYLEAEQQSDLFRFTLFFEELKRNGWRGYVLPEKHVNTQRNTDDISSVIYVNQSALVESFNDRGELISPLDFSVKGNVVQVQSLLNKFQFNTEKSLEIEEVATFKLIPF